MKEGPIKLPLWTIMLLSLLLLVTGVTGVALFFIDMSLRRKKISIELLIIILV